MALEGLTFEESYARRVEKEMVKEALKKVDTPEVRIGMLTLMHLSKTLYDNAVEAGFSKADALSITRGYVNEQLSVRHLL